MPGTISAVLAKHAEEVAFLWAVRDAATDLPHYRLPHLARLEARIEAHIDGLRVAGDTGFEVARANLGRFGGPGELFLVATLALESRTEPRVESALKFAETVTESRRGLFGALGWVAPEALRGRVIAWLEGRSSFLRLVGVVACSLHRADPGSRLERLLDDEPIVRARGLRLAGELGRIDLRQRVVTALDGEDEACRFWAAWSAGLLGDRTVAVPVLKTCAADTSSFQPLAVDMLVRLVDAEAAVRWLREFGRVPEHERLLVIATGAFGDPVVVSWLIERMSAPVLARVAGESFSMITGADPSEDELEAQAPEDILPGPTEPGDEYLPWPDALKVRAWWQQHKARFTPGVRHLGGSRLTVEGCNKVLRDGSQRQRRAAAYELALMRPGRRLWNWRAKVNLQTEGLRAPVQT